MTLDTKGVPSTAEGTEARAAMETTKQNSDLKIKELLNDSFSNTIVFQAGGNEISGLELSDMIEEAANNALQRLYPQFKMADHSGWDKAYSKAKAGAPDALKSVGYEALQTQGSLR